MSVNAAVVLLQESPEIDPREWIEAGQALAFLKEAGLKASGHLVRTARQRDQLAAQLRHDSPRVICVAVGRHQAASASAFLNAMRGLPATNYVVIAGSYGTLLSHEFTPHDAVQAVLLGEWVEALAEFTLSVVKQGEPGAVTGAYMRGYRGWFMGDRRTHNPDLGKWPEPLLDNLRPLDLIRLRGGVMPILASRGFPFQTLFSPEPILRELQQSDFYYHVRPPARVVEEAQHRVSEFGVVSFDFVDSIFPWPDTWTQEFADLWRTKVGLPFSIRSAAEYVTPERVSLLRAAGLARVEFRLEGGSEKVRQRHSDLNQTNARVVEAIRLLRSKGIETSLKLLISLPLETPEQLRQSIELARLAEASATDGLIHHPWPESPYWEETLRAMAGEDVVTRRSTTPTPTPPSHSSADAPRITQDALAAQRSILAIDSLNRSKRVPKFPGASLDGLAEFPASTLRSPLEGAARIDRFHAPSGSHDVIALRVPSELCWEIQFPNDPAIEFGILLKAALPGERTRLPVSFSIRASQNRRSFRVFQKILTQALDPDSRRWHWFRIPLSGVRAGTGTLIIENLVIGEKAGDVPADGELWAGWSHVVVATMDQLQAAAKERADKRFEHPAGHGEGVLGE